AALRRMRAAHRTTLDNPGLWQALEPGCSLPGDAPLHRRFETTEGSWLPDARSGTPWVGCAPERRHTSPVPAAAITRKPTRASNAVAITDTHNMLQSAGIQFLWSMQRPPRSQTASMMDSANIERSRSPTLPEQNLWSNDLWRSQLQGAPEKGRTR